MTIQHTTIRRPSIVHPFTIANVTEHEEPGNQDTLLVSINRSRAKLHTERKSRKQEVMLTRLFGRKINDNVMWTLAEHDCFEGKVAPGRWLEHVDWDVNKLHNKDIANSAKNDKPAIMGHGQQTSQMAVCFAPHNDEWNQKKDNRRRKSEKLYHVPLPSRRQQWETHDMQKILR